MPRIACFNCGRSFWATAPVDDLLREERQCPRCGSQLSDDRRVDERRVFNRRMTRLDPPGGIDRREGERRKTRRRKPA